MQSQYAFDRCEVRPAERQVLVDGVPAALGARAFDLLMALMERRDRVVEKAELFDAVWPGLVVEENNLQVQVSSLRKLLGTDAIATVPGRGYQFVKPLTSGTGPAAEPATPAHPNNLPHLRTRFIGRECELADCADLLGQTRLLTLSGIGGCGKTRLAQELAQRQLGAFPDGVWFVDLGPLQEAQRVSATLAGTLGVQTGRLTDHLKAKRTLIVMDNCEHVVSAAAKSIGTLLESCGALKIVATSREVLGMAGEQVFAVRSLSLPETTDVEDVRRSEAARLFVDHARLVAPEFDVDEHNAAAVAEICRRLDGIALAIELAAARIRVLSVEDIRARLDDRFRLLTGGNRALPRHQTLQATMQWSHDHLTDGERETFRRLAVFAGGCTLDAAARVVSDDADEYDVLERLTALHDKSLVLVDRDTHAHPRYRMLETVRQYAEERLNEVGEGDEMRTRHLLHYVALAERAGPELNGARWSTWYEIIRHEEENVVAAHAWCDNVPGGGELALRLAGSTWRYWANMWQPERGFRLAERALACTGSDSASRCNTLIALASHAMRLGRYEALAAAAAECLAMARRLGVPELVTDGLYVTGLAAHVAERTDEALACFIDASDRAQAAGDMTRVACMQCAIGEARRLRGDLAGAEAAYVEAIRLARSGHDLRTIAVSLPNLASVLMATGRASEAKSALADRLALQTAPSTKWMVPCSLDIAAALASMLDEPRLAARFHGAMRRIMHDAGTRHDPVDDAFIGPRIDMARQALGDAAFDAEVAEGWAQNYDTALAEMNAWLERPVDAR